MKVFELRSDGRLPQNVIDKVGDEYSLKERIESKVYGIGHLKYISGNPILNEFFDRHNNAIKTHFDWTKKGAVIRLRTTDRLYGIGLNAIGFKKINLLKQPDRIYAMPFMPFWILLKLGVSYRFAKWFIIRGDRFIEGKCELNIEHDESSMFFELSGDIWADCLHTFAVERTRNIITIEDKRTWAVAMN